MFSFVFDLILRTKVSLLSVTKCWAFLSLKGISSLDVFNVVALVSGVESSFQVVSVSRDFRSLRLGLDLALSQHVIHQILLGWSSFILSVGDGMEALFLCLNV